MSATVWNDITFMAAINIIKCDRGPFGVKVIWLMWTANTWIDNITDSPIPTKFRTGWIRGKRELTWKYIFARSWHVFASSELGVAWSTAFTLWCSRYVGTILFSTVSWITSFKFEQKHHGAEIWSCQKASKNTPMNLVLHVYWQLSILNQNITELIICTK